MKFYIDGKIMTSKDQPLIVILSDQDKKNIANMHDDQPVYCIFQDDIDPEEMRKVLKKAKIAAGINIKK